MSKILLGMSGGKDSTWACRVLQNMGYEVEGLLLVLHDSAPVKEAQLSAERLGIRLHVVQRTEFFRREVEDYFANEYLSGRTPNPCVECNSKIKFALLAEEADRLGIEKISTGHYVRAGEYNGRYTLSRAGDEKKDQSYFLWQLSQEILARFVSPLQELTKDDVVKGVVNEGLIDEIRESQEICFVPDDDYISFLRQRFDEAQLKRAFTPGDFVTLDGRTVGKHNGCASYTVGQRKGLGIALGRPAYVVKVSTEDNRVILGFEEDNLCDSFTVDGLNFVSEAPFEGEGSFFVRPRYRSPLLPCNVNIRDGCAEVNTNTPVKLVSPGQSAVFYDREGRVAFGGKIR